MCVCVQGFAHQKRSTSTAFVASRQRATEPPTTRRSVTDMCCTKRLRRIVVEAYHSPVSITSVLFNWLIMFIINVYLYLY